MEDEEAEDLMDGLMQAEREFRIVHRKLRETRRKIRMRSDEDVEVNLEDLHESINNLGKDIHSLLDMHADEDQFNILPVQAGVARERWRRGRDNPGQGSGGSNESPGNSPL